MITIPILSKTEAIIHAVSVMTESFSHYYNAVFFDSTDALDEYVRANACELMLLDLTDSALAGERYLDSIQNDARYRLCGVLAVVSDEGARMALEMEVRPCLLLSMNEREFLHNCTRLFKIIKQNIQFVFNRFIQSELRVREVGSFTCDNDAGDIIIYTNLLVTYLGNTRRIDFEGRFLLQTALMEMLLNALEHGNCNINYDAKSKWLETGNDMLALIAERNKDPAIARKKITISYEICAEETHFGIKDEGDGFDWREMLKKDIEPGLHGMGIKMTEKMVKRLSYNDKGNEVFFSTENAAGSDFLVMRDFELLHFAPGETVKAFDAADDTVYFFVNGTVTKTAVTGSGAENADSVTVPGAPNTGAKSGSDNVQSADTESVDLLPTSVLSDNVFESRRFALTARTDSRVLSVCKSDMNDFIAQNPYVEPILRRICARAYAD